MNYHTSVEHEYSHNLYGLVTDATVFIGLFDVEFSASRGSPATYDDPADPPEVELIDAQLMELKYSDGKRVSEATLSIMESQITQNFESLFHDYYTDCVQIASDWDREDRYD